MILSTATDPSQSPAQSLQTPRLPTMHAADPTAFMSPADVCRSPLPARSLRPASPTASAAAARRGDRAGAFPQSRSAVPRRPREQPRAFANRPPPRALSSVLPEKNTSEPPQICARRTPVVVAFHSAAPGAHTAISRGRGKADGEHTASRLAPLIWKSVLHAGKSPADLIEPPHVATTWPILFAGRRVAHPAAGLVVLFLPGSRGGQLACSARRVQRRETTHRAFYRWKEDCPNRRCAFFGQRWLSSYPSARAAPER